jgi:small-conductance mechanosensitive channel
MQEHNPYAAPSANLGGKDTLSEPSGAVTMGVVNQLARTKGWTRLSGVLLIIVATLLFIVVAFAAFAFKAAQSQLFARNLPTFVLFMGVVIYGMAGVLYLIAGLKLNGFSSAIQRLLYSGKESDLDDALDRQRSFWVYCGILAIIVLVLTALAVLAALGSPTAFRQY